MNNLSAFRLGINFLRYLRMSSLTLPCLPALDAGPIEGLQPINVAWILLIKSGKTTGKHLLDNQET